MRRSQSTDFLTPAPENYVWPRCPEADRFIENTIGVFLAKHPFAAHVAERMKNETSTRFSVWVDHLLLPTAHHDEEKLEKLGFWEDKKAPRRKLERVFFHPFADLPRIVLSSRIKDVGCAIMVEDIWKFQLAHNIALPIAGAPFASYRVSRMTHESSDLLIVERRGSQTFIPDERKRAELYLKNLERWGTRPRHFFSDRQGMAETLKLAKQMVKELGTGQAAHIFLEAERAYWECRNAAGRIQKARQDRLGLGWANHDHHTFRSSRAQFPMLMEILLTFGFKKRERYFAGAEAGWGAQIVEQPEDGTIIFADVDLAPADIATDFSQFPLSELEKHRTVGLWCALHGDSILAAGMHHLEAKFDYERLRADLKAHAIETMPPFSDFSFLRQAFTKAEMWKVSAKRLEFLHDHGQISDEAYKKIKSEGAVGSHLENLQRTEGFKGFNQKGVSAIITAVNPETQALKAGHRS